MPVARDLQDIVSDLTVAIAERRTLRQADLIVLRRKLAGVAEDAREAAGAGEAARMAVVDLIVAAETSVADLAGRVRHARGLLPAYAAGARP